jgi:2-amino-4-hydroxy-6-hydroxymethyldihydropteridine diphosphokinase
VILIALGANLPAPTGDSPLETCRRAVLALDRLPGLRLRALSRWYRTMPVPPLPGSPPYVNGLARLEGSPGDPARLLAALQAIEDQAGRQRPFADAPRTLDLDLIDLDGLRRQAPDPILPHPRAHLRRFVLQPLQDVAPDWVHPGTGQTVAALLAALPAEPMPQPLDP